MTKTGIGKNTFIYPNPVRGHEVHARIILNGDATVGVEVYNLEGERALAREYSFSGVVQTPFDEIIDVGSLKSGVYMMRLRVQSSCCSTSLIKSFAIVR